MKKIAIYGKGGIGKSTTSSNISAALSIMGYKVMQIGCDPKADSTINLLGGIPAYPVLTALREDDDTPTIDSIVKRGFNGIMCIETGGPTPGIGCAGRGIVATFNLMEELNVFEVLKPDVVIYDVLGDVVCGGFATPIREGYAEDIYIVTSGEKMSLFAANNIMQAVDNFRDRGYATVKGLILNCRNVDNEYARVQELADRTGVQIAGVIPRSQFITDCEDIGKTVVEADPERDISKCYMELARKIMEG